MLCNGMEVGVYSPTLLAVGGGGVSNVQKKCYVTLEYPLSLYTIKL